MRLLSVSIAALVMTAGAAAAVTGERPVQLGAYYATWAARAESTSGIDDRLAGIPEGVTEIFLAFMRPDATYAGGLDLAGTGLQVPYSGPVLKASLKALRARIPGIRILVSIGGEKFANWNRFDPRAARRLVEDFDLDGVDLDFEPADPRCGERSGQMSCDSDALLLEVVEAARATLPRPIAIWLTATNTGAYGEGPWSEAPPIGGPTYGAFLPLLRDAKRRALIDGLSLMAYDAGPTFRPLDAYAAYRSRFEGPILIGLTSPPEAWGGHAYTVPEAVETVRAAIPKGANGAMVWAIGKENPSNPGPDRPGPDALISALIHAIEQMGPN
ncbi:glycoside hydrolase family 18 protein [Methylobacterium planeticum]|uniref:Glycoside hydrolase family 18 protein n=1 Tax=Methylobacterium planeticum TaxID=2615211 RepID=A0A6N6MSA7_9HYPH|nr:glycosyl hydrolase family 18 protein [Methylobacterium planeticum]KAB1073234.1 glycoside hydrolase family 18 protein [Methylobacterium planeticum]